MDLIRAKSEAIVYNINHKGKASGPGCKGFYRVLGLFLTKTEGESRPALQMHPEVMLSAESSGWGGQQPCFESLCWHKMKRPDSDASECLEASGSGGREAHELASGGGRGISPAHPVGMSLLLSSVCVCV